MMKCKLLNKIANLFSKPEALAASGQTFYLKTGGAQIFILTPFNNRKLIGFYSFIMLSNNMLQLYNNGKNDIISGTTYRITQYAAIQIPATDLIFSNFISPENSIDVFYDKNNNQWYLLQHK